MVCYMTYSRKWSYQSGQKRGSRGDFFDAILRLARIAILDSPRNMSLDDTCLQREVANLSIHYSISLYFSLMVGFFNARHTFCARVCDRFKSAISSGVTSSASSRVMAFDFSQSCRNKQFRRPLTAPQLSGFLIPVRMEAIDQPACGGFSLKTILAGCFAALCTCQEQSNL